jgi:hypothetical protein
MIRLPQDLTRKIFDKDKQPDLIGSVDLVVGAGVRTLCATEVAGLTTSPQVRS